LLLVRRQSRLKANPFRLVLNTNDEEITAHLHFEIDRILRERNPNPNPYSIS
jgi:hypothetical protein